MVCSFFCKKNIAMAGAITFITLWGLVFGMVSPAQAEFFRHSTPNDLFYNQYVQPVDDESVGATLYPCPRPVPPFVGYTFITYQPLAPHEFLYKHARHYTTFHDDAPRTRTNVRWR